MATRVFVDIDQPSNSGPILSWHKMDCERRFGIRPGKQTQVSSWFSGIWGLLLTAIVFGVLFIAPWSWKAIFLERGPTPYFIVFFFAWSLVILVIKRSKLRIQKRVLEFEIFPADSQTIVSVDSVPLIVRRMKQLVDEPERFCLYKRILTGLTSLENLGRISDVGEVLRSQAEADDASLETSYAMLRGFLWGIPVLGFIGTVLGLSQAIGGFGDVLAAAKEVSAIADSLRGVTAGLATAFDTTLLALLAAIIVHFFCTVLRKQEEEFLDACTDYCQTHIIDRLKVMPISVEDGQA